MKKKSMVLVLALALLVVGMIGGTLAWLTDTSEAVVNTFTTSDIDISLDETTGDSYKMVPGYTIVKDPQVTVLKGSEECYLFVKLEESQNFDTYLEYTVADGWTALDDSGGIYYRVVKTADMGTAYQVLGNDQVTVKGSVTKGMMNGLNEQTSYPQLKVTAYASQYHKNADAIFTAAEAWANVADPSGN